MTLLEVTLGFWVRILLLCDMVLIQFNVIWCWYNLEQGVVHDLGNLIWRNCQICIWLSFYDLPDFLFYDLPDLFYDLPDFSVPDLDNLIWRNLQIFCYGVPDCAVPELFSVCIYIWHIRWLWNFNYHNHTNYVNCFC